MGKEGLPLSTLQDFRQELATKVKAAKSTGMSNESIEHYAEHVGDWLAGHVAPKSPEQALLKEMWQVADQDEQHAIADVLVKFSEAH